MADTFRTRLLLTLAPVLLAALALLGYGAYRQSRAALLRQIDREAQAVAQASVEDMDVLFRLSRTVAQGVASAAASARVLTPEFLHEEQRRALEGMPPLFGITVAFAPGATPLGPFADYLHREGGGLRLRSLAGPDYGYQGWDWFREPLRRGTGTWAEPYLDTAAQRVMITYAEPIRRNGKLLGVVAVDLTLDQLSGRLRELWSASGGEAYLVSPGGKLVASTQVVHAEGGALDSLLRLVRHPGTDRMELTDPRSGRPAWLLEQPLAGLGAQWSLVLSAPTETLLQPLHQLRNRMLLGGAGLALLLVLAAHLLSVSLSRPVQQLLEQTRRYAAGEFGTPIAERSGIQELRRLSEATNRLGASLLDQMEAVRAATAQKERYRQELAVAAELQQAMLPKLFPPVPGLAARVDLHAFMRPAREVGGDVFDFIPLPGGRLGLLVGDVSDKGVPAALFMAETRLLVRMLAGQGLGPAEVLRRANHILADEASGGMFVTLAYLEYEPADGTCTLASAGHPAPLLVVPGEPPRELRHPRALPLGAWPGVRYDTVTFTVPEGGWLVVYSDGVSEAMDARGEAFGLPRLAEILHQAGASTSAELAAAVSGRLQAFTGPTEPSDDLTLLVLRRLAGAEPEPTAPARLVALELPTDTAFLALAGEAVTRLARQTGLTDKEASQLALAVDEAFANLIHHAPACPAVRLELSARPGEVHVVLTDTGAPFDFEAASRRYDGEADAAQPAGGIGLFLLRRMVDTCTYEPGTLTGNRLTLVKRRGTGP